MFRGASAGTPQQIDLETGNTFEHLNGTFDHIEKLMGSGEDLNGNIFLMIDHIARAPIVSKDKLRCTVLCTVSGECSFNIYPGSALHQIEGAELG